MRRLEFWYDFASTYSYLSAMRIEELAAADRITIAWRPFLLGPIFRKQGWETSPFSIYPAKGRYMIRDMQRICHARGLHFRMPATFPARSITAARLALLGEDEGWIGRFTRAVFAAEFGQGADIAERDVLAGILGGLGLDFAGLFARIEEADIKDRLRQRTLQAEAQGIFGAPTFLAVDGELFWGDDRLQQALTHTTTIGHL